MLTAKRQALLYYERYGARRARNMAHTARKLYKIGSPQDKYWKEVTQWLREPRESSKGLVAGWYSQINCKED